MKFLLILVFLSGAFGNYSEILTKNLEKANQENKNVVLYFSGSDWCGACLKFKKNVLDTDEFLQFSNEKFIFVTLDFPQRSKATDTFSMEEKEKLAEKYNPKGTFPLLVILDKNGNTLKEIRGYKGQNTAQIIQNLSF